MEIKRQWYEAEVLVSDLTCHRHTVQGDRVEEIEKRMRLRYPRAEIIFVSPEGGGSEISSRSLGLRRQGNARKD